ncbi:Serine/threonine-protein kinase pkn1 [Diplonema papillatum]|nr:Serine/threonine-protein kinase pkn1 [Diplonema papillatum]
MNPRKAPVLMLLAAAMLLRADSDADSCSAETGEEQEEGGKSCGCDLNRAMGPGEPQAAKQPGAEGGRKKEQGSGTFRNRTEDACTAKPHYEGYRVGCIHNRAEGSGLVDCGMTRLPGGTFRMGTDFLGEPLGKHNLAQRYKDNSIHGANPSDAEHPAREVKVQPFAIDTCEVTNGQFKEFADATNYVTDAELYGWSFVLEYFLSPEQKEEESNKVQAAPWWRTVRDSSWRAPEGFDSSLNHLPVWYGEDTEGVPNAPEGHRWAHPVAHVSWRDAYNFCRWRGKRLPKEAEWEYAARGGLEQKLFPWGDELYPGGRHRMNIWQGSLETGVNTAEDGARGTAPVASYPPNAFGIFDMSGNIWEWVDDDYNTGRKQQVSDRPEARATATEMPRVVHKTKRGGSHMCHASSCNRYRTSGRTGIENDSSAANLGFRCAKDVV